MKKILVLGLLLWVGFAAADEIEQNDYIYFTCNNATTPGALICSTATLDCYNSTDTKTVDGDSATNIATGKFKFQFTNTTDRYGCFIDCCTEAVDYTLPVHVTTTPLVATDNIGINLDDVSGTLDRDELGYVFADNITLTEASTDVDKILAHILLQNATVTDASATTTRFETNLPETTNGFWTRAAVLFTSGANKGQMRGVQSYAGATGEIKLQTAYSNAPAVGDNFSMVLSRKYLLGEDDLIDQIWDENSSDHTLNGTFGGHLDANVSGVAATIDNNATAAAVWNYNIAGQAANNTLYTIYEVLVLTGFSSYAEALPEPVRAITKIFIWGIEVIRIEFREYW